MKIDIISLFPEFFDAFFTHSIIKRALLAKRLEMKVTNPREFSHSKHGQVDDTPYGGGAGMLMKAPPLFEAVEHVLQMPIEEHLVDATISIGDYVLTGGELPAMVVADAVARMIPGVLGATSGAIEDSFYHPVLECPQYTKPQEYRGMMVPDILLSGHHKNIAEWRLEESLKRTALLRNDLLQRELTVDEIKALKRLLDRVDSEEEQQILSKLVEQPTFTEEKRK